jgi:restriction system protein
MSLIMASDWRVSASAAAGVWLVGVQLLPAMLAANPLLVGVGQMVHTLAWGPVALFSIVAFVKLLIALGERLQPPLPGARIEPGRDRPAARRVQARGRVEPTALDGAWTAAMTPEGPERPDRPSRWSRQVLEQMEWKRFEDLCCAFYREKGIRAEVTPLGPDGGIDIALHQDADDPARVTAIVQCKAWNQAVGVKPVRELRGVMAHKGLEKAFFMAPQGFTDEARAFAGGSRITLLDGRLFLAMIERLPEDARARLLDLATAGEWTTPTCPACGRTMVARQSRNGPFWGCPTYPRCRAKLPMRAQVAAKL